MGDHRTIAAVTGALQGLLINRLSAEDQPTAEVRVDVPGSLDLDNQNMPLVNLFLYQVMPHAGWRNQPLPSKHKPGERARPPLALSLRYLVTAYGDNASGEIFSGEAQRLLGEAMAIFHTTPLITKETAELSPGSSAPADLPEQIDKIRISPLTLDFEAMSKIWSSVQASYRISVAYEVNVALLEPKLTSVSALPVKSLGANNSGVKIHAGPGPQLLGIHPQNGTPFAYLGEVLQVSGTGLSGDPIVVDLHHSLWDTPQTLTPYTLSPSKDLTVMLPSYMDGSTAWPPGLYTLNATVQKGHSDERTSNSLPFLLAPEIDPSAVGPSGETPLSTTELNGITTLQVLCRPLVHKKQNTSVILKDQVYPVDPASFSTDTSKILLFQFPTPPSGTYPIRLRVDGVDSPLELGTAPLPDHQKLVVP